MVYHQSKSVDHLPEIHNFSFGAITSKNKSTSCLSSSKELTGSFHVIDVKLTRFNGIAATKYNHHLESKHPLYAFHSNAKRVVFSKNLKDTVLINFRWVYVLRVARCFKLDLCKRQFRLHISIKEEIIVRYKS
jgi:hypothetical protein